MCVETLWGASDGLVCLRVDDHATGHIYGATWAPDRHDSSEPNGDY